MATQDIPPRVNPSSETIRIGPLAVGFLITKSDSGGSVSVFEVMVPRGVRLPAPAHSHDHYEETIYGIEGVLTWTVNRTAIEVGPGEVLCIARGAVHRFDNMGSKDAKALCVITPAEIGPEYFREVAEAMKLGGPPDTTKLGEIMRRHGLTPAAPG